MSVALDIGRYEVKIVHIQKTPKGYALLGYGSEPLVSPDKEYDPEKIKFEQSSAAILRLVDRMKIKPKSLKKLVTNLNNQISNVRQVKLMNTEEEDEMKESLQLEARKHIPMDGSDVTIDFQILGEDPQNPEMDNILLVASTQKNLNRHLENVKQMGFPQGIVDADAVAIANSYLVEHGLPEDGAHVFLNIGSTTSTLVVWGRVAPFFTRDIQIGGHHMTKELVDKRNISYNEAENLKKSSEFNVSQAGVASGAEGSFSIAVAEHTIYDSLVDEIRRSLRFYIKESSESNFHKLFLTGGGARTNGLVEFITEKLNIHTEIYNPIAQLHHDMKDVMEDASKYAIAVGLAIRGELE